MNEMGTVDEWKELNPNSRSFTHYSPSHNVYSQIDFFFTFRKDLHRLMKCDIGSTTLSDHFPVILTVNLESKRKLTSWKINSNILNNSIIKKLDPT